MKKTRTNNPKKRSVTTPLSGHPVAWTDPNRVDAQKNRPATDANERNEKKHPSARRKPPPSNLRLALLILKFRNLISQSREMRIPREIKLATANRAASKVSGYNSNYKVRTGRTEWIKVEAKRRRFRCNCSTQYGAEMMTAAKPAPAVP